MDTIDIAGVEARQRKKNREHATIIFGRWASQLDKRRVSRFGGLHFLRVDLNEEWFSFFFSIFPKFRYFLYYVLGKTEKLQPRKRTSLNLEGFSGNRYKAVEDRAAPPLELRHHSRAHKADKRRSQGHPEVMAEQRGAIAFWLSWPSSPGDGTEVADRLSSARATAETLSRWAL